MRAELPRRAWLPLLALLVLLPLQGSCAEIAYYWQAGMGQLEIINKRRPITEVLEDPAVAEPVKERLRLVLDVQAFGTRALALPEDGHYTTYADLGRPVVSWLVVAAPPLSLEAHRFCYLIVGCLGYRGYFAREDADELAAELRGEGLDVTVRPVSAYSTLGWFSDPVLNTFLMADELRLTDTIIHEQAHRRVFVKGDTDFNESFAEFVAGEGVRSYLSRPGADATRVARYDAGQADEARFREIVLHGHGELSALYASALPEAEKLARKAELLEAMRQDYHRRRAAFTIWNYDGWFEQPLNNAHLVGITQYARHVRAFHALYEEQGRDFARFYAAVAALGELEPAQRTARLNELEHSPLASPRSAQ